MKLIKYFNIPDLLILAIAMITFKVGFLDRQAGAVQALGFGSYLLLVFATVLVAGGGFFMNNVFGYGKEPNTEISESAGYNIYMALNIIGIGIAYYLGNTLNKPVLFSALFAIGAATMYFYATGIKQMIGVSNIVAALLTSLPVITIGLFQLYPLLGITTTETNAVISVLFRIFIDYSIFTFFVALALTVVNDLAANDADYNAGISTLPIVLGRDRAAKVAAALLVIPLALFIYYANTYLIQLLYALGYSIIFILGLIIYCIIRLLGAKTQKEYQQVAGLIKLVLLFTAFSIAVITFNINYVKH